MEKQILRFTTAGSVDDGKSTLIGRLLFETNSIASDQLDWLEQTSRLRGSEKTDFSLLTDGLRAEREQGITIDVAYRYFETAVRRFIIADNPGHLQYTRNMVTGASQANLAVILVDARKGLVDQTYRHTYILSLLRIRQIILCINKMDLVEYQEKYFRTISDSYLEFCRSLSFQKVDCVPMVATNGDFISHRSAEMKWYSGETLLHMLECAEISANDDYPGLRFPVQYVIRPKNDLQHDFRGYAGQIARGMVTEGQEVIALPSGLRSKITGIYDGKTNITSAFAPASVTITLDQAIDIGRGDLISSIDDAPDSVQEVEVMICWLHAIPLTKGKKFLIRHHTAEVKGMLSEFRYQLNISDLSRNENIDTAQINDLVCVNIRASRPLFPDKYSESKAMGAIILIDEVTGETLAAGIFI